MDVGGRTNVRDGGSTKFGLRESWQRLWGKIQLVELQIHCFGSVRIRSVVLCSFYPTSFSYAPCLRVDCYRIYFFLIMYSSVFHIYKIYISWTLAWVLFNHIQIQVGISGTLLLGHLSPLSPAVGCCRLPQSATIVCLAIRCVSRSMTQSQWLRD